VFVALSNQNTTLWPARLYTIFPRYLIHGTIFGGGGGY
jgi:hypothetical protein